MTERFWLQPKWVAGHVICLTLVILFVNLGFWQLERLDEKRERNALIHQREQLAPTTLEGALADGPDAAVYRRVVVRGRWRAAETVLVRSRSLDERPGYDVLTPLVSGDRAVIVNRGFAPLGGGGESAILQAVRPPGDVPVEVRGLLRASEQRGSIGPRDSATGRIQVVSRIDVARLQQQSTEQLVPVYLQQQQARPETNPVIDERPPPATDEGPHLSYAVQWFIFAAVGAIGWPLLLRKTARDGSERGAAPDNLLAPQSRK